ncbi:hypothetical protein CAC42_3639 [Sphaceloma murrayae]|uniref:Uncharacterized protein n=1 Tax=Sphaceloma murrayae TaxID=2082308 RepID=A0A2K1QQ32_9PEZI|nr:hypothetical protein CAC42_3639 [Sphaceloma murrayae]
MNRKVNGGYIDPKLRLQRIRGLKDWTNFPEAFDPALLPRARSGARSESTRDAPFGNDIMIAYENIARQYKMKEAEEMIRLSMEEHHSAVTHKLLKAVVASSRPLSAAPESEVTERDTQDEAPQIGIGTESGHGLFNATDGRRTPVVAASAPTSHVQDTIDSSLQDPASGYSDYVHCHAPSELHHQQAPEESVLMHPASSPNSCHEDDAPRTSSPACTSIRQGATGVAQHTTVDLHEYGQEPGYVSPEEAAGVGLVTGRADLRTSTSPNLNRISTANHTDSQTNSDAVEAGQSLVSLAAGNPVSSDVIYLGEVIKNTIFACMPSNRLPSEALLSPGRQCAVDSTRTDHSAMRPNLVDSEDLQSQLQSDTLETDLEVVRTEKGTPVMRMGRSYVTTGSGDAKRRRTTASVMATPEIGRGHGMVQSRRPTTPDNEQAPVESAGSLPPTVQFAPLTNSLGDFKNIGALYHTLKDIAQDLERLEEDNHLADQAEDQKKRMQECRALLSTLGKKKERYQTLIESIRSLDDDDDAYDEVVESHRVIYLDKIKAVEREVDNVTKELSMLSTQINMRQQEREQALRNVQTGMEVVDNIAQLGRLATNIQVKAKAHNIGASRRT